MGTQEIGHYSLPCKNTDLFVRLEEKLNHDYPQLKNYETYFENYFYFYFFHQSIAFLEN